MKKILLVLTLLSMVSIIPLLIFSSCEHEHNYGEWEIVSEPTCTENGKKIRVCKCGDEQSRSIVAKGHVEGEWVIGTQPTCTEAGIRNLLCSACNVAINSEPISALGHADGEWVTDSEPTCTQNGSKHQNCAVCGESIKTEKISANGHTEGDWQTVSEPTCTKNGSQTKLCKICGATISTENLNATGHTWNEATCTLPKTCSLCDATTGNALGHTMTPTSSNCIVCNEFEYYELRAVRMAVDLCVDIYNNLKLSGDIDSYEIMDIYYQTAGTCQCSNCDKYEYEGFTKIKDMVPYINTCILARYFVNGEEYIYVDIIATHKYEVDDYHYSSCTYGQEYTYYYNGYAFEQAHSNDYSFHYKAQNMKHVNLNDLY